MPEQAESELLPRAKSGERGAFDLLRQRLEPRIRRFVHRLVGKSEAEEDIIQDAFVALFRNLARIDTAEHLLPFMFRVVRNRCYDELRRNGRFQWVSLDEPAGESETALLELMDHGPRPDQIAQWSFALAELRRAIDRLPELQRQTMILFCDEELSYPQIAAAMATDLGTVKSRIFYARNNLRCRLRPEVLEALGIGKGAIP